jgi:DNA repair protein RecN (Recombination protein N)
LKERLSLIHDIARKHHSEPKHLFEIHHTLKTKLNQLEHRDDNIAALEKTQHDLLQQYKKLADRLTASRKKLAKQFNQAITDHMRELGIQAGEFKLQLTPIEEQISPYGQENLWFSVKTNPQQPFQAMQKIVSGGELSRISLAVQLITAQRYQTPSLIFDEVDVGIGGKTAATVGTLLRELSEHTQVLCITHLPQVAAYAHHHYKVEKHMLKDDAITEVSLLNKSSQVQEIARMLGGREITKQTLAHAEELISV